MKSPSPTNATARMLALPRKAATSLIAALLALSLAFLPACSATAGNSGGNDDANESAGQPSAELPDGSAIGEAPAASEPAPADDSGEVDPEALPAFSGEPYVEIDGNVPHFSDEDKARGQFEEYAPLDALGRCGEAFALVGHETQPTEKRGSIGMVKPSGWHISKYDWVDGKYLYNRCHLIGYQLAGENANDRNLVTGTRYLNTEGMLPFENDIDDYVDATGNHVLYRVTPVFEGSELVARGVHLEALSVEDGGSGVSFNVYCYNAEPGVAIDYATGDNWADPNVPGPLGGGAGESADAGSADGEDGASAAAAGEGSSEQGGEQADYVLNTNTKKFHRPDCPSVSKMKAANRQDFHGTRDEAIAQGYEPCAICKP